ncbi:MAG: hypothetical protein KDD33_07470 [Bdellovibrionales bacterium]|nr:hypothetical protein [Bdellovibrionales bacterium]
MEALPAVAKSVYFPCSKCETERYHRVLAHLSSTEAKLECEVCGKKAKLSTTKEKTKSTKKKKTTKKKSAANAHAEEWKNLMESHQNDPQSYNFQGFYLEDTVIDHPTFGLGIVTASHASKIEVCFEEGVKTLIHKRDM